MTQWIKIFGLVAALCAGGASASLAAGCGDNCHGDEEHCGGEGGSGETSSASTTGSTSATTTSGAGGGGGAGGG